MNCEVVWYEKAIPFVIWHQTKESSRNYPSHWHLDLEIDMVFDGELETLVNGKCIKIREGDVHVFNSREIHSMTPHTENFFRAFKKHYHMTPSQYRATIQEETNMQTVCGDRDVIKR